MFRPNRIGSTNILQVSDLSNTGITTHSSNSFGNTDYSGRVINAAPVGDFAQSKLMWATSASLTTLHRTFLGQQFTMQAPIQGNAVGLELKGGILGGMPNSLILTPILAKLTAAGASQLAAVTITTDQLTIIGDTKAANPGDDTVDMWGHYYNTTAVVQGSPTDIAGTWVHGFMLMQPGATASTSNLNLDFCIRQLNDQQNIGYRDTRR